MADYKRNLPNFFIPKHGVSEKYKSPKPPPVKTLPSRNREEHAEVLRQAFSRVMDNVEQQKSRREEELAVGEPGFYLEFQLPVSEIEVVDKLENRPKKIELLAVRSSETTKDMLSATVFVPEKASDFFPDKIKAYRDEDSNNGNPKNQSLITRLNDINLGTISTLFTDNPALFPDEDQAVWWEIWLRRGSSEAFHEVAQILHIRTTEHIISFPEREVVLALTDVITLSRIIINNGLIAELRLAEDMPSIFFEMNMQEQLSWVKDLSERIILSSSSTEVVVCLLDSGVNASHFLIKPALAPEDLLTCNPSWGVADSNYWNGHGTEMAGIALYGDLYNALTTSNKVYLSHKLESIKILPDQGQNDPQLYGAIAREAVSRAEINKPKRQRVFCMAVTSPTDTNQGIPSSWSAAVDQVCSEFQRLMIIPVGNIREDIICSEYPNINDLSRAENPSQAWNALVVGAYTDKVNIVESKYANWQVIAPAGDLSPRSRTSILWTDQWPVRPDVTFEGGNLATDGSFPGTEIDDLQLLTTYYQPNKRQFNTSGDTSAATALAKLLCF